MRSPSPDSQYEPPIRSETFAQPVKQIDIESDNMRLFVFNPNNRAFVEGAAHTPPLDGNGGCWFIWTMLFALWMVPFMLFGLPFLALVSNLSQRGVATQAIVISEHEVSSRSTAHYVLLRYTVSGQSYTTEQEVSDHTYQALAIGDDITIRYLPDDPRQARLSGANTDNSALTANISDVMMIALSLLIGIILCANAMRRDRQLTANGRIINGRLVDVKLTHSKSGYNLTLQYSFTSPVTGQSVIKSESISRVDLKKNSAPAAQTPVKVLFLNDKNYRLL